MKRDPNSDPPSDLRSSVYGTERRTSFSTTAFRKDSRNQINIRCTRISPALVLSGILDGAIGLLVALVDFVRGDLLARTNRPEEAAAAFHREIENFPTERQAYANLAVLYFFGGRPAEARKTMEDLVRRNPGDGSNRFAAETFESIGARDLAAPFRAGASGVGRAHSQP
jgi:tetratricopeptide (TPR) repeat protein